MKSGLNGSTFRVEWGTGYIDADINTFFFESKIPQVRKLFKLARQECHEEDRTDLLTALAYLDKERKALQDALREVSFQKSQLANSFFRTCFDPEQGWAEKRLATERKKLKDIINILTDERWL